MTGIQKSEYFKLIDRVGTEKESLLEFNQNEFDLNYNRHAFLVNHNLRDHPLFEISTMIELCRRHKTELVKFRYGIVPDDAQFDTSFNEYNKGLSLEDVIGTIESNPAYIVIYYPELDSVYKPFIESLIGEIASQTERVDPVINWFATYIFISSNHSTSPFHADREMNFLLQVKGKKSIKVWDRFDNSVTTSAERDLLVADTNKPKPSYKESFADKSIDFELSAGEGVHIPYIAPHMVSTGEDLSISLAVTFRTNLSDIWADAHCFNNKIRKLHLTPSDVGHNKSIDIFKAKSIRAASRLKNLLEKS